MEVFINLHVIHGNLLSYSIFFRTCCHRCMMLLQLAIYMYIHTRARAFACLLERFRIYRSETKLAR